MDDLHNDKNWIAFERKLLTVWCIYRKGYHNIPINKRNGRKQAQHLKIARFARDLNYEDENGWRKGNGRNPKKEIVLEWRKNNTTGKKIDCHRDTGLDPKTIRKWWNE